MGRMRPISIRPAYDEAMTTDDAFFEALAAINADMASASARFDEIGENDGSVLVINRDDTESIAAVAKMKDAQQRLAALLATVKY